MRIQQFHALLVSALPLGRLCLGMMPHFQPMTLVPVHQALQDDNNVIRHIYSTSSPMAVTLWQRPWEM